MADSVTPAQQSATGPTPVPEVVWATFAPWMSREPNLGGFCRKLADWLLRDTGCDSVILSWCRPPEPLPPYFAYVSASAAVSGDALPRLAPAAVEWIAAQGRCLITGSSNLPFAEDRQLADLGYLRRVYVPLVCGGRTIGVIALNFRQPDGPGPHALRLLEQLGPWLAVVFDNYQAHAELLHLQTRREGGSAYLPDQQKNRPHTPFP